MNTGNTWCRGRVISWEKNQYLGKSFLSNMKRLNEHIEEMEAVNAFSTFKKLLIKIHTKGSQNIITRIFCHR